MKQDNNLVLNQSQGYNVTGKYVPVKTQDIIDKLVNSGFQVTNTVVTKPRKIEKLGFQKHMIRLSHNDLVLKNVNDSRPELVIVNSHDATTSIQFLIGIFRLVCANGLVVGKTYGGSSIRHTGDVFTKIDESLDDIRKRLPMVAEIIQKFSSIHLTQSEIRDFTNEAIKLLLPKTATNVSLESASQIRRQDDDASDLWTVYNRVQETFLNGGVKYQTPNTENPLILRPNTSRRIKSIDRQLEVNQGLWTLADEFSKVA